MDGGLLGRGSEAAGIDRGEGLFAELVRLTEGLGAETKMTREINLFCSIASSMVIHTTHS